MGDATLGASSSEDPVTVPGGHGLPFEEPAAFTAVITDHLDHVTATA